MQADIPWKICIYPNKGNYNSRKVFFFIDNFSGSDIETGFVLSTETVVETIDWLKQNEKSTESDSLSKKSGELADSTKRKLDEMADSTELKLDQMATKEGLKTMDDSTKEKLNKMATKEELKTMDDSTKGKLDEMANLTTTKLDEVTKRMEELEKLLKELLKK